MEKRNSEALRRGSTRLVASFLADTRAAVAIEYGILATMIAVFILSIALFGESVLNNLFEVVSSNMAENTPGSN
ncbi:Flp family type IVb pilin [Methylobrevis pamukkalensis]|uniref:Flp/Fap pilin component n=1 Tax=Methylobrevis pamukkalensis TaxID=1439726 RepID=A0A1E3GYF6_9HYPH|nr:Flp family type IVb pilin [Methylobrevis pamukkalensis]ODN69098.1 Flp/Fap pilin component [Methylobrevis pamukkalensis]